jgi:hypothetical protein
MIGERLGGLDEWLVSRDRRAIQEKDRNGTEDPKVVSVSRDGNYLSQDLTHPQPNFYGNGPA